MSYLRARSLLAIGCGLACSLPICAQQSPRPKIILDAVKVTGAPHLANAAREHLAQILEQKEFQGGSDEWLVKVDEISLEQLSQLDGSGYIVKGACATWQPESQDSTAVHVSVTIDLTEAPPPSSFRLTSLYFKGTTAFPQAQLRNLVPLKDGEIVTTYGITAGLAAIAALYEANGFMDFTISTDMSCDNARKTESIVFVVDEGQRYRIGTVRVYGLDAKTENDLRSVVQPGQWMRRWSISDFYASHKDALPPNASPQDVQLTRHDQDGKVDLVFDFISPSQSDQHN
jgi:outer membrane protein assembly factor BamA